MEMKEKLYKEKVYENKLLNLHYNKHEIKPNYRISALFSPLLLSLLLSQQGDGYGFYRRKPWQEMTSLPSSRVPLQLETTPNTKPACSAAEIRGRTAFWLLIGRSGALCKSSFWESSIDRLRANIRSIEFYVRSIDLSGSPNFQLSSYEIYHSSLIVLTEAENTKTNQNIRK
jgi:hypothetical protein